MQWLRYWDGLEERPARYWLDTEFELLEIEQTPEGVTQTTVVWKIVAMGGEYAHFEVRRGDTRRQENYVNFHPGTQMPDGFVEGQDPLVTVSVPAGEFRCVRISLEDRRKGDAEVDLLRDEWRAPNVPVPIQTWERPRAMASGELREPPADPGTLPLGCTFSQFVAVRPTSR